MGGDKSSEYVKQKTDKMVGELINDAYKIAVNLIRCNIDHFNKLAQILLNKKTIDADDFNSIVLKYFE